MWFKNLQIYRLSAPWTMTPEQLEEKLAPQALTACSSIDLQSQGWISPRENGMLVHTVNRQMLILLGTEKKLLPATVVNQVTKARAAELEEQQGFAPGRKQMRELKEEVTDQLLPRAFSIQRNTWTWIDPVGGWLIIDAASPAKADEVFKLLLKSIDKLPAESLRVARSPLACMTEWLAADEAPSGFTVGKDVAATPGKVVFRNALIELIQYAPSTPKVGAEPVLIVPAWIMKYYILDLSPGNSLIRWLVAQGRTVFAISWRNPNADMAETTMDDYRTLGVMAAVGAVQAICGDAKIHATGYCLGGTLLTIAAAAMARDHDDRFASMSLFAAQTDFTEAGELELFITEDQLNFLNDIMKTQGYLSSAQMGGAFQMLQSNDLIWSHAIRSYLLGEHEAPFDLMAWDADGTRLPARMHIEYLRRLYLRNELAEGHFPVAGRPVLLDDIKLPMFLVGTERDHIAPWHSVFKLHLLNDGELTFVLTSGGHNAGIVSEPGHPHRHFRMRVRETGGHTFGPDEWEHDTVPQDGSWWVEWNKWLGKRSSGPVDPPPMGAPGFQPICEAPGTYVLEG